MTAENAMTPLDVLKRDGWCKWKGLNGRGERCLLGATIFAPNNEGLEREIRTVIREQFPERAPRGGITAFNDHRATTFADVELVLEKAQLRLDEQVSPPVSSSVSVEGVQ